MLRVFCDRFAPPVAGGVETGREMVNAHCCGKGGDDENEEYFSVMEQVTGGVYYMEDVPSQPFVSFEVPREGY